MNTTSPHIWVDDSAASDDVLRRLRHELRTPVNHLLGYTELLLEEGADHDPSWLARLGDVRDAGRELLEPIGDLVETLRLNERPEMHVARIRELVEVIHQHCDVLDAAAQDRGDDDAAGDLAVVRNAATTLLTLVSGSLERTSHQGADPGITVESPPPDSHKADTLGVILVVDDNRQNRELLSRLLQRLGHTVEVAAGGREALSLLRDRTFDILLLDVMMPEMDGFEVLSRLKADPALRELPVIMLSALDDVSAAVRCIEMGADDYLPKPIDTVLLRARIGSCLERKRLRDTEVEYLRQAAQVTGPAMIAHLLVHRNTGDETDADVASLLAAIERESELLDTPKGRTVFTAGDDGGSMYVVLSGRIRIDEADDRGQPRTIGEARRGGTLGELEMLTGQPRSTSATAVRDARLVRLGRHAFERLSNDHPRLLTRTTHDVVHRLREAFQRRPNGQQVTTFTLVPVGDVAIDVTARDLARALATHGDALHLDRERLSNLLGHEASAVLDEDSGTEALGARLNEIELDHRYVVYQADPNITPWTRRCLRQADHVLLVGRGTPPGDVDLIEDAIVRNAQAVPIDLLLLHPASTIRPTGTIAWLQRWHVRMHHHLRDGDEPGLARLARRLTGNGVDLVLGGGGARGWAHVGVIRAFTESGIPIDGIAGTSMGALIGGAHMAGLDWREIEVQASKWGSPRQLFDYTLPLVSIIAGNKITTMLQTVYDGASIEDLWRTFFCVSSSLSHARPVIHRKGPLWRAVRASISLPGFLPPVPEEDELLIDGAYLNNLPTDLARDIYRSGTLVAVSVSQAGDIASGVDVGPAISGWSVLRRRLLPWEKADQLPGVAATILRSSSLSGTYNLGESAKLADHTIIPQVDAFGTLDFAAYKDVIQAGYEAACRQLESWQDTAAPG